MQESFTIKQLLESGLCPVRDTRLRELIQNGVKFQKWQLGENIDYLIAWKSGPGEKASWIIDWSEIYAWKERAKNRNK